MTSRERVIRALEFDHPDRVPRDLWVLPIARLQHGQAAVDQLYKRWPTDFGGTGVGASRKLPQMRGDPYAIGQFTDGWGCTFESIQAGVIGEVKHPLIDDWSKLDDLREPTEMLNIDVDAVNAACKASDRFITAGCCARPFERCQFLRGSENLYYDLAEESAEFAELLRRVHRFYRREIEVWATTDVDAITFMDDWGSQQSLLISPAQWRRLFKPLYAEYVAIAHEHGKKALMHSDGHIFAVYEDLIEIGLDAVNSQLFCMDIEEIGRRFKGRITFWGEIDRQHILPEGSTDDVRGAVKRVVDNLYDPSGGVIAQFELGAATKLANAHEVFQAWSDLTTTE